MTSRSDSGAVHTPDSDLIDEPRPANTEARGRRRTLSSVRRSRRTHHHHQRPEWAAAAARQ
ncbi:uncharacterized protein V6R79_022277 [Siganus canaliculatus]